MNRLIPLFLGLFVLGGTQALAQTNTAESANEMRMAYESKGIHFDQVQSMIATVTQQDEQPSSELLMDFLRTIETFQAEGAPVPMSEAWLERWTGSYGITNEQAQDLYKVALRFALQPRRE